MLAAIRGWGANCTAASGNSAPAEKVAAETKRIADIKSRKALRPGWLDAALRAAGVIKEGETL